MRTELHGDNFINNTRLYIGSTETMEAEEEILIDNSLQEMEFLELGEGIWQMLSGLNNIRLITKYYNCVLQLNNYTDFKFVLRIILPHR